MREERSVPRVEEYDPGRLLTYAALLFVGLLILFVAGIICMQIWKSGEANTESWAALTGLIGWATSQVSIIFSNKYGNTQQAAKKDAVLATAQARALVASTGTGNGPAPVVPAAPIQTETVNIETQNATLTERKDP